MITKSRLAQLSAGVVGVAVALSFAITPVVASASTIAELQAMIASLSAQLAAMSGTPAPSGYTFNTNLTVGSTGADVMNLQKVLNMSSDTMVASGVSAGAPGHETSTFGPATKAAVMKFQTKNGISPVAGYVGPVTRAKLNSMSGSPVVTTPGGPVVGGSLVVGAASQPVNSLLPQGVARVPFTTFTLTNTGSNVATVNGVTVQRVGLGANAIFSGIVLVDSNNVQIGTSRTLNSNDQATVGDTFTINPGETKTLTIAGNAASSLTSYNGQTVSLNVVAVNSSASVSGSFPIMGASHTANNTLSIGSVSTSTSAFDPGATQNKNIGDTNVKVSGVKFTAGSTEDLKLFSIRWRQVGTGSSVDVSNVVTIVNGTSYPTTVSTDGKYYTSVFPGGLLIPKGQSVDIYNQVDLTGSNSAARTIDFDIDRVTDVYFVGQTYGYGVAPSGTYTPWFNGFATTINAGTVTTISKANEVAAQNIASNVSGQPLGGFATNFAGEPVSVTAMTFTVSTSTATIGTNSSVLTSVSIVDDKGVAVAGPLDATVSGSGLTQTLSFTDTVTFPVGRHVYTLKGKLPASAVNGAVLSIATTPSGWSNPTGQVSNSSVTISTGAITMNSMTVKGAALQVNISAQPASRNVVGGVQNFVIANFQLDATQSGEDVRLSAFPVYMTAGTAADYTGCTLWNGSTPMNTGTNVVNTWSTTVKKNYTFDNSLVIAKGTLVTLALACNVASSPTAGSVQATAPSASDFSVTGLISSSSVTPTVNSNSGGTMTVGNGSFAVSVDSSLSPATTTVAGGTTGVNMGVFKFRATNEDVSLTKVGLKLTLGTASHVTTAYIYNGATQVGSVTFPQGSLAVATSTLSSPVLLSANTDVSLTVKADIANIGTQLSGNPGQPVIINAVSAEGSGLSSGSTLIVGNITPGASGVRTFRSIPTVAASSLAATGVADGHLMRFKVTADPKGPISVYELTFTLASSSFATGGGVTNLKLNAYSDSAFSSPVPNVGIGSATGQFGATNGTSTVGLLNAPLVEFQATTNALQIGAGSTVYFDLVGTVSGVTTGTSVTSTLLGDAAFIASAHFDSATAFVSSTTGAYADTNNNFIWSGNSTTTPNITNDTDWANGFQILGLPSGGFSQTRSQ